MRFESKKIERPEIPMGFGTEYVFRFYIPTDELLSDELTNEEIAYAYAMDQVKKQVGEFCDQHLMPGTQIDLNKLSVHFEPNESYASFSSCCDLFMPGTFAENIKQVKKDLARYRREMKESDGIYGRYTDRHEELSDAIWCCLEWLRRNGIK